MIAKTASSTSRNISAIVGATWALFVGILFIQLGSGLQDSLIGVRSANEGFDAVAIGVIVASYYAGYLAGSRVTFKALGRVGHIRVFAALASLVSAAIVSHSIFVNPLMWTAMRFLTGMCMAGLFVVAESWVNDAATNSTRGFIMSTYMVVALGGKAGGQVLLNFATPSGFELFVIASVLISVSLVPVALSGASAPPVVRPEPLAFSEMRAAVPTGLLVMFASGLLAGTLGGLTAVYGTRVGMSPARVSLFIGIMLVGAIVLQIPIGAISDRLPRRKVMLFVTLIGGMAAFGGTVVPSDSVAAFFVIFWIGAFSYSLYGLGVAYTNDWIEDEKRAGATKVLVTTNAAGATIGPIVASVLMRSSPVGFYWMILVSNGALAAYLALRIVVRAPKPVARQSRFSPFPDRATSMIYAITRRKPTKTTPRRRSDGRAPPP